jgi:ubiquinone/menaquinone biosynthesis C-methylase UbiE
MTNRVGRSVAEPLLLERGSSTAVASNVAYRLGKLRELGLLQGEWLDCGCADGGYTIALAHSGAEHVVGIDIEEERVLQAQARNDLDMSVVSYCCGPSETLPFRDASFDGVFLNEVLEHVEDEIGTLREIYRVLRPGGYLVLMSPNRWFPFEGHGMCVHGRKINIPIPFLPWIPSKVVKRFMRARNYWPSELRAIVHRAGFEVLSSSSVFPMFEIYPWLPASMIPLYRQAVPSFERAPVIQLFGVSTFIHAQRPSREVQG